MSHLVSNNTTITMNGLKIVGNNNTITGNLNKIVGNNNKIIGNDNKIVGNNNTAKGYGNIITGNNNTNKILQDPQAPAIAKGIYSGTPGTVAIGENVFSESRNRKWSTGIIKLNDAGHKELEEYMKEFEEV